jgi:glycosyltransferase involved in cell wall biosynthesis
MLSFVIPAYNEENNIKKTIDKIYKHNTQEPFEIHVVDNGSTDDTIAIARNSGAHCSILNNGTIAALRNFGVNNTHGDILIFIDADISLTDTWHNNIDSVLNRIRSGERLLTGSFYSVQKKVHG